MNLTKTNVGKLTHLEAGQLVKTTLKDIETGKVDTSKDVHISNYIAKLVHHTVVYDKALLQVQKNEETEKLASLDQSRDMDLAIFRRQLKVYGMSKKTAETAAYQSLIILWKQYNDAATLNYEAESNAIDNLVQDLESSKYAPHVAALRLTDYLKEIKISNALFKDKFSNRNTEVASTEVFNMKAIRKDTFATYRKFCNYVLSLSNVEEEPATYYKEIINIINTSRKYYADMLAKRNGGNDTTPPMAG
jgi:Family of unknown function (DUF6261)